jgi:phosphoenolpyruvate carboxykinase (GTP)
MLDRCAGRAAANDTAIGFLPRPEDLNLHGLAIKPDVLPELLSVKPEAWRKELKDIRMYLEEFGQRTPKALYAELDEVEKRLG